MQPPWRQAWIPGQEKRGYATNCSLRLGNEEPESVTNSDEPPSPLIVSLLGPFCLQVNGARLPRLGAWRQQEAILALLILRHPHPLDRSCLAGLLWPECSESQGLATLRRYLTD